MTTTAPAMTEFDRLIAGIAKTDPHNPAVWRVANDWRGDRGLPDLSAAEVNDLICDHPTTDGPRLLLAEMLEGMPETEECPRCKGKGVLNDKSGRKGCGTCGSYWVPGSGRVPTSHRVRAAFIRDTIWMSANHTDCPVRLADMKRSRPVPLRCGRCEYCQARRRCEQFYAKHRWAEGANYAVCFEPTPLDGSDFPSGDGLTLIVRRGFVSEVRCFLATFLAHLDALAGMPLETVRLTIELWSEPTDSTLFSWWRASKWDEPFHDQRGNLSDDLFDILMKLYPDNVMIPDGPQSNQHISFDTPELAHAALSTAAIALLAQRRKELRDARSI